MNRFGSDRRDFLKTMGLGLASASLTKSLYADVSSSGKRLNFVFVLADDLGWNDLACYGSDLHETPNLDRLAEQSLRFTNAYAAAPVCTPTRASIMTGKCPARLNMTIWSEASGNPPQDRKHIPPATLASLPFEQVTLAEVFKKAGYYTAHLGKWHLGDAQHYPETQGFDLNIGGTLWGAPNTYFYPYSGSGSFGGEFRYVPHLEFGKEGEYLTDRLTDEAIRIIEKVKDQPFFLNLAHHSVHTPIECKPELVEYYRKKVKPGMHHQNPEYAAMVHNLDENIGRLLNKLDELALEDKTVFIFFSDNGGYINPYKNKPVTDNYPLRSGKGSLYEGGIREPLIIRLPGVTKAGSICTQPVSSIDFYPTLLEIFGLKGDAQHNKDIDGISLASLLKEPQLPLQREALCWHYPHYYPTTTPVSAIRAGDWKLLEYFEDVHLELYNIKDDLSEKNNLVDQMRDKAKELHVMLKQWRKDVNAQMSKPNVNYKGE